jgi:hypothetical protein
MAGNISSPSSSSAAKDQATDNAKTNHHCAVRGRWNRLALKGVHPNLRADVGCRARCAFGRLGRRKLHRHTYHCWMGLVTVQRTKELHQHLRREGRWLGSRLDERSGGRCRPNGGNFARGIGLSCSAGCFHRGSDRFQLFRLILWLGTLGLARRHGRCQWRQNSGWNMGPRPSLKPKLSRAAGRQIALRWPRRQGQRRQPGY